MFLETKTFYRRYDPGAVGTAYAYGRLGSPSGHPVQGKNFISNPGSSLVWTAVDGTPFDPVNVGDVVCVFGPRPDGRYLMAVTSKTDGTVINGSPSTPTQLAGSFAFMFWPFKSGTGVGDGWHSVNHFSAITVHFDISILASTSIEAQIQGTSGPLSDSQGVITDPDTAPIDLQSEETFTVSGETRAVNVDKVTPYLRVGLKATGPVSGDRVHCWVTGEMLQAKS